MAFVCIVTLLVSFPCVAITASAVSGLFPADGVSSSCHRVQFLDLSVHSRMIVEQVADRVAGCERLAVLWDEDGFHWTHCRLRRTRLRAVRNRGNGR
jgi:hypothetical protein